MLGRQRGDAHNGTRMTSVHDAVLVGRLEDGGHVVAVSVRGRVDVGPATAITCRCIL
jgi:hypothetical protein